MTCTIPGRILRSEIKHFKNYSMGEVNKFFFINILQKKKGKVGLFRSV